MESVITSCYQDLPRRRWSNARQLGRVFQYMKPPKSILRKSTDMQRPIQRVQFTKAIARHTKIRDKIPSFGNICPGELYQCSPNAPKFEDWSQEERVARARWPRISVEAGQKCIQNSRRMKEHRNRCLLASTLKLEEREFVVDSGASMHMTSKKDLSDTEMDTLTKSCSPTIVLTANGEVHTHVEATVCQRIGFIFWLWKSSITRQQYCRSESFAMKTGIPTDGSMVKNHISLKTGLGYSAIRRT